MILSCNLHLSSLKFPVHMLVIKASKVSSCCYGRHKSQTEMQICGIYVHMYSCSCLYVSACKGRNYILVHASIFIRAAVNSRALRLPSAAA